MRFVFLAATAIAMSCGGAQAEEWCGYAAHTHSLIECGYSSINECQSAIGKGAMCFVDPEVALNRKSHFRAQPDPSRPTATALVLEK